MSWGAFNRGSKSAVQLDIREIGIWAIRINTSNNAPSGTMSDIECEGRLGIKADSNFKRCVVLQSVGEVNETAELGYISGRAPGVQDRNQLRHQMGGTLGGPIAQNRLFFFGGYQRTTLRQDPANSVLLRLLQRRRNVHARCMP